MSDALLRQPVHDQRAEEALLGCAFRDATVLDRVDIPDDAWYALRARLVWASMRSLRSRGRPVDVQTVLTDLERSAGSEGDQGGVLADSTSYVLGVADSVPSAANAPHYAETIVTCWRKRELAMVGERICRLGYERGPALDHLHAQAERLLMDTLRDPSWGHQRTSPELADDAYQHLERVLAGEIVGYQTGYKQLDGLLCGLEPGGMTVIAARPSVGKTTLTLNLLRGLSEQGIPNSLVSLEMTSLQITQNLLSSLAQVPATLVREGRLSTDERRSLIDAMDVLRSWPLVMDDGAAEGIERICGRIRALANKHGSRVVAVDYMQLIQGSGKRGRYEDVTEISQRLKATAKDLGIHLLAVAQLSRKSEDRNDKRPQLGDLRDSGAIEQDCDVALLLHRPSYYDRDNQDPDHQRRAYVIVAKNRNGPTGTVEFEYDRPTMTWAEGLPDWRPPGARQ